MRVCGVGNPLASPWHPGAGFWASSKSWATAGLASGWVPLHWLLPTDQIGLPDVPPQSLSLLSCSQLLFSFHDCMSARSSQAPRQLPPLWYLYLLPPAMVGAGDRVSWHVPITMMTLTVSCSFIQCPEAHGMTCSRPVAPSTTWFPRCTPCCPGVGGRRLSASPL